jgi:hypothetical protein
MPGMLACELPVTAAAAAAAQRKELQDTQIVKTMQQNAALTLLDSHR